MLEQLGGADALRRIPRMLGHAGGPVNWELAGRVARQLAAEGDRQPTDREVERHREALDLAEHWLDESPLPAPPDGGRLMVASRQEWVGAALDAMPDLVEPVAAASTRALTELTREELEGTDLDLDQLGLGPLAPMLQGAGISELLEPVGATLTGMQAGQVIGKLSRQLLGQYELGVPTAPRATAVTIAVNATETFTDWGLDDTEVAVALALHEAAHRRLFHAVPWLQAHLQGLVARFADGMQADPGQLHRLSQEMLREMDPEDPESLQEAMRKAASFRMEPTPAQERVLERLQGVVTLVGAWARHEVARCGRDRLPHLEQIEEVLRRRRAVKGDGEELLEQLLGLDLQPPDESLGEQFVTAVEEARGPGALRRALAHPENLPDATELADPSAWLARMSEDDEVPEDPSALFGDLGEAPVERSARERLSDAADGPDRESPGRDDTGRDDTDPHRLGGGSAAGGGDDAEDTPDDADD